MRALGWIGIVGSDCCSGRRTSSEEEGAEYVALPDIDARCLDAASPKPSKPWSKAIVDADVTRAMGGRDGGIFGWDWAGEAAEPAEAATAALAGVVNADALELRTWWAGGRGALPGWYGCCVPCSAAASQAVSWSEPGGTGDVGVGLDGARRWWKRENMAKKEEGGRRESRGEESWQRR